MTSASIEAVPELPKYRSQRPNPRSLELGRNQAIQCFLVRISMIKDFLANNFETFIRATFCHELLWMFHELNVNWFSHLMRCFGRLKCWSGCWSRCKSPGHVQTLQLFELVSLQVVLQGWQALALGWRHKWVGESDTPLNHCLFHSTVPLPVPHHCVPSQHATRLYHRMPCTGSIYQHLSSTLITPGVSLSFVWDVRCITWKSDFILVNRHVVELFFVGLRSLVWEMYPGRHHQRPLISPYS